MKAWLELGHADCLVTSKANFSVPALYPVTAEKEMWLYWIKNGIAWRDVEAFFSRCAMFAGQKKKLVYKNVCSIDVSDWKGFSKWKDPNLEMRFYRQQLAKPTNLGINVLYSLVNEIHQKIHSVVFHWNNLISQFNLNTTTKPISVVFEWVLLRCI